MKIKQLLAKTANLRFGLVLPKLLQFLMLRLFMDTNAYVFAACKGNELSYEPPELGHGIFTYSIVNTLKDPDARDTGNLSVLGLSSQVR